MKRLNNLLSTFTNKNCRLDVELSRSKKDLDSKIIEFEAYDKTNWLNMNGFYSFYIGVKEGFVTYCEFGLEIMRYINNQSTVNKLES